MKLKSIEIANFKAFGKEFQTIPIKPITLVFGPNSAGKSSIIHSLLWLNHAVSRGQGDVFNPALAGKSVDLGGFNSCLNRNSGIRRLRFSITLKNPQSNPDSAKWQERISDCRLVIACARDKKNQAPAFIGFDLFANDALLIKARSRDSEMRGQFSTTVIWDHPALAHRIPENGKSVLNSTSIYGGYNLEGPSFPPTRFYLDEIYELLLGANLEPQFGEEFRLFILRDFPNGVSDLLSKFNERIQDMNYLPPFREVPDRLIDLRNCELAGWHWLAKRPEILKRVNDAAARLGINHRVNVGTHIPKAMLDEIIIRKFSQVGGGEAWPHISTAVDSAREAWSSLDYDEWARLHQQFFKMMADYWYDLILGNPDLRTGYFDEHPDVDRDENPLPPSWWMEEEAERLARTLLDEWADSDDVVFKDAAAKIFISEDEAVREAIQNALKESGSDEDLRPEDAALTLRLYDKKRNVQVALQDVGVGTSQVLPIVIEAHAQKDKLIAVEQPELHLHPRLQAELGDVFIESALGENKNTFLLETHSEHLLLRVMRRMRQTFEGTLPEGIPSVRPDDVALLYVSPGADGSVVQEIGLNERGELIKGWPGGFFEEGFNEMFD